MTDPNEVLVVAFPGEGRAQEVLTLLQRLNKEHVVHLKNAAVIVRDTAGKVSIRETRDFNAKQGAMTGALAGGLLGLLRGELVQDAVIGAAAGFAASKVVDLGFKDNYLKELSESLQPGSSAIVAVVHFDHLEQAMQELDVFEGGKILRHSLSPDVAAQLSQAVED